MEQESRSELKTDNTPEENVTLENDITSTVTEQPTGIKKILKRFSRKQLIVFGCILAVLLVVILIVCIPSKFDRVKNKSVQIAGRAATGKGYFTLDTYPDEYEYMSDAMKALLLSDTQENTLAAIKYANEALGFSGAVYSEMLNTTALMGRQTEENGKYKVTWTYHPDDGLEVTYSKEIEKHLNK